MKTHQFFLSILAIVFVFAACSNDVQNNATNEETQETEQAETVQKYKLTPFEPSYDFPDAKLESMSYKNGKFTFTVTGESYKLGAQTPDAPQKMCANSAKGQHIHLIIDNQPYVAKYTNEFEYDVPDGEHYILAFISRSYHESIKHNGASIAKKVTVKDGSIVKEEPITEQMIFYSRPKGKYVGKAETDKVMLDFYLVNVGLSANGNKVKVNINGEQEFIVDSWQPYYIEGLPMGDNKIELTLLDKDGNPVASPLNPVERVFTLVADPVEEQ